MNNLREKILDRIDFLSDHWVNGDDKPPFSFGGWRDEVAYDLEQLIQSEVKQANLELLDRLEIPQYAVTDVTDDIFKLVQLEIKNLDNIKLERQKLGDK